MGYNSYIRGTTSFHQTRANEAKMGAYYTDLSHCRDIAKMFVWPEGEEVCVLEPSIGDGSAVIEVTKARQNPNVKIYGVELNDRVAGETAENPLIRACVNADFLDGFTSRNKVFTFCFANPPYLSQTTNYGGGRQRTERDFLERIGTLLKKGGVLVWVVAENTFFDPSHVRMWLRDYEMVTIFKFRQSEYEKYHQIVAVGIRREFSHYVQAEEVASFTTKWHGMEIPELPEDVKPCIRVLPSQEKNIDLFTTKVFDSSIAEGYLKEHGMGADLEKFLSRQLSQKQYVPAKLGRPPIPLKKDSEYLLLTSGFTDGLVGDENEGNLHLMRGVAAVVDHERIQTSIDEDTDEVKSQKLIVTTSTEVEVRIIEADGRIRLLGADETREERKEVESA